MKREWVGPLAESEELRAFLLEQAQAENTVGLMIEFGGTRGYLKGSALRGKAGWRHALRARLLGRPYPRVAEYTNLQWLRAHNFRAPEPLAAGVLRTSGCAPYQFLMTQELPNARTLDDAIGSSEELERLSILAALGCRVAELHAAGFIHRDLYPRNLLYSSESEEVIFIDAWRGGARRQLRGHLYDQACLMLHGADWFSVEEQAAYFRAYADTRGWHQKPIELERWLGRIQIERARLAARFTRKRPEASPLPPVVPWETGALKHALTAEPAPTG